MSGNYNDYYVDKYAAEKSEYDKREAELRQQRLEEARWEFHCDLTFDEAVEKLESFDGGDFVPGVEKRYGDRRVYFRVFEEFYYRTKSFASLSVFMEGSPRFGVDILAIVSGAGDGYYNFKAGAHIDYAQRFMRHMGLEIPKEKLGKRLMRYFFE